MQLKEDKPPKAFVHAQVIKYLCPDDTVSVSFYVNFWNALRQFITENVGDVG